MRHRFIGWPHGWRWKLAVFVPARGIATRSILHRRLVVSTRIFGVFRDPHRATERLPCRLQALAKIEMARVLRRGSDRSRGRPVDNGSTSFLKFNPA
jgi:hypothetical protein